MDHAWALPWRPIDSDAEADFLIEQLHREATHGHALYRVDARPIARRDDLNDVLFVLADGRHAVVSLTWTSGPVTTVVPWCAVFDTFETFAAEFIHRHPPASVAFDESHPANAGVVAELRRPGRPVARLEPPAGVDPFMDLGCHPDTVSRVWTTIGERLPAVSRCLLYDTPALVHPRTGVALGFASGMTCFFRVPPRRLRLVAAQRIDSAEHLGDDWVEDPGGDAMITWCREAFTLWNA